MDWERMAAGALGGAVVGWLWHRLVGCRTGTCPIAANPYVSALYGAFLGVLLASGR
ncbi:MAG: YtxH domain-containing protein [Elusimicrobia bacterium]|nr:YtxH domain-containing protein [Elusimicrobiota bacterium]